MQCPRLTHFVRLNFNGTYSRCGHMVDPPQFASLRDMEESAWLDDVKTKMEHNIWPDECVRCRDTESVDKSSIRINSIEFDKKQKRSDYLIIGGVLDNICNSGCITCNEYLSTKIGSIKSKVYPIFDNYDKFWQLPTERVVHIDINGGEPSASKNYKQILKNLPSNVQSVRVNTNCSMIIDELQDLINRGIKVTVTVSLDGINEVHDQVRWPIKWDVFYKNLLHYKNIKNLDLNTWTTVSALNIHNFETILQFVADHKLAHSYAFLNSPDPLNVKYKNSYTLPWAHLFPNIVATDKNNQVEVDKFIQNENSLRGII